MATIIQFPMHRPEIGRVRGTLAWAEGVIAERERLSLKISEARRRAEATRNGGSTYLEQFEAESWLCALQSKAFAMYDDWALAMRIVRENQEERCR